MKENVSLVTIADSTDQGMSDSQPGASAEAEAIEEQGSQGPSGFDVIDHCSSVPASTADPQFGHLPDMRKPEHQGDPEHEEDTALLANMAAARTNSGSSLISTNTPKKSSHTPAVPDGPAQKVVLPSFASQVNKDLAAAIQQLEKDNDSTDRELDQNLQRISLMSNHLRSLQLELDSTESRLEAKSKELKTEQDLQKLNHYQQVESTAILPSA